MDRNGIKQKGIFNLVPYDLDKMHEQEIKEKYYDIIEKSVVDHLSDNRVAIAFSGGIDTNTIISVCAKHHMQINTFTVNFITASKARMLDYEIAKERSKEYGAFHHELRLVPGLFLNSIDETINSIDRLVSFDYLNNVFILDWVANFNKLVFTGDGTEEQLGSYSYSL